MGDGVVGCGWLWVHGGVVIMKKERFGIRGQGSKIILINRLYQVINGRHGVEITTLDRPGGARGECGAGGGCGRGWGEGWSGVMKTMDWAFCCDPVKILVNEFLRWAGFDGGVIWELGREGFGRDPTRVIRLRGVGCGMGKGHILDVGRCCDGWW